VFALMWKRTGDMNFMVNYCSAHFLKTRNLLLVVLLILCQLGVQAQSLSATVSRNPVGVNEKFELKYVLEGSASRFTGPALSDFIVHSGPNQSQSVQIINGSMSQSIIFSYILQPKKEGSFKIGPAKAESGGRDIASNSISLTVVKGQGGTGAQQNQDEKTNISSNTIFIRVQLDKTSVYRGEGIVVSFKLYSNAQLINYAISKVPAFTGFWNQDLEMPPQLQLRNEVYNGVNYQVGEIKKVILYPQQSGTLTIDPMEGEVIARVQVKRNRSNNPFELFNDPFFNDPFFGAGGIRDVRYAVKSDPVRITVKDLPPNAPASFQGAVGRFSMEAGIDKLNPKTNDAVTLKMKVTGSGNLKLLEAPDFAIPSDIEKYEPTINDQITFSAKGASGSRVFEYLMIPRVPGKYDLGEVEFSYFDPAKKAYTTLKKGPFTLNVAKGPDGGYATTGTGKADFKVIGRDIRFIKTTPPAFISIGNGFAGSWVYITLLALPLFLFGGALVYYRKHKESLSNTSLIRSRKAGQAARKRLAGARKSLDAGDQKAFYEGTYKALWDYAGHKLGIDTAKLNREVVTEKLAATGIETHLVSRFGLLLDRCEMSRFAGSSWQQPPSEFYEEAVEVLTQIENGSGK
jgi:hypothetical protein